MIQAECERLEARLRKLDCQRGVFRGTLLTFDILRLFCAYQLP